MLLWVLTGNLWLYNLYNSRLLLALIELQVEPAGSPSQGCCAGHQVGHVCQHGLHNVADEPDLQAAAANRAKAADVSASVTDSSSSWVSFRCNENCQFMPVAHLM
jgi:phosphoribosylformylglycinamidine (FGAM) synthase-like amidotransferase family enzyme